MSIGFLEGTEHEIAIAIAYRQVCDACDKPFTEDEWDDRHSHHEPGCPLGEEGDDDFEEECTDLESAFDAHWGCDCDLNYHPHCCPVCNRGKAPQKTPKIRYRWKCTRGALSCKFEPSTQAKRNGGGFRRIQSKEPPAMAVFC